MGQDKFKDSSTFNNHRHNHIKKKVTLKLGSFDLSKFSIFGAVNIFWKCAFDKFYSSTDFFSSLRAIVRSSSTSLSRSSFSKQNSASSIELESLSFTSRMLRFSSSKLLFSVVIDEESKKQKLDD